MSRDPQRLRDYLSHIAKAIERIDRYTLEMTEVSFMQDEMAQDAVIRNFEVIGEASRNLPRLYQQVQDLLRDMPRQA